MIIQWTLIGSIIILLLGNLIIVNGENIPPDFKVAFIGDQGLGTNSVEVLQMIANEGADMVLHQGDFDYTQDPQSWDAQINSTLGPEFPYFASVGNHDIEKEGLWENYQIKLQNRLDRIENATCIGDLGVKSSCHYKGLFFILSGIGTLNTYNSTEYVSHLQNELANDNSTWSICSWHKNQNAMQVGGKTNEVGWEAYETCKQGGAIIATGHEHSYERTKTLSSMENQTVNSVWNEPDNLAVGNGSSFAFVSGLGGKSIRNQLRCLPETYPYGCNEEWASIYTNNQGATYGALFCNFSPGGIENKAICYFKDVLGNVPDSFTITSLVNTPNILPSEPLCYLPQSGNWTVNSSCLLYQDYVAPENVIIQNNAVLTIPNGTALNIDFKNFNLIIKYGGGVLIKSGGKLTSFSG